MMSCVAYNVQDESLSSVWSLVDDTIARVEPRCKMSERTPGVSRCTGMATVESHKNSTHLYLNTASQMDRDDVKSTQFWKVTSDYSSEDDVSEFSSIHSDGDDDIRVDISADQRLSVTLDDDEVDETSDSLLQVRRAKSCRMSADIEHRVSTWLWHVTASQRGTTPIHQFLHCHTTSMQRSPALSNIHAADLRQCTPYRNQHVTSVHSNQCPGILKDSVQCSLSSILTEFINSSNCDQSCDGHVMCDDCDSQMLPWDSVIDKSFCMQASHTPEHNRTTDSDSTFYMRCPLVAQGIVKKKLSSRMVNSVTRKLRNLFRKH